MSHDETMSYMASPIRCAGWAISVISTVLFALAGCVEDDLGRAENDLGRVESDLGRTGSPGDAGTPSPAASCASVKNSPAACYFGAAFVDCAGTDAPRAYCKKRGDCRWSSNGCPVGEWSIPLASDCSSSGSDWSEAKGTMASFFISYGARPWTRSRAMNLHVSVDPTSAHGNPSITCPSCTQTWCSASGSPCKAEQSRVSRVAPGTLVLRYYSNNALAGWYLQLEVDPKAHPMRARACRHAFTDVPRCSPHEPACAASGSIRFSTSPTKTNWSQVSGDFQLTFDDGARIVGAF